MSDLARAIAKCQHRVRNAWCAYLTPSEYLALLDNGAKPDQADDPARARDRVRLGDSGPRWMYFSVGRKLQAMLPKPKQKKVGTRAKM